jgi:hypothetical protein
MIRSSQFGSLNHGPGADLNAFPGGRKRVRFSVAFGATRTSSKQANVANDPQRKSGGQFRGDARRFSLSDLFARSAQFCRKIFKLWQTVAHGQNGPGIIDVDTWIEFESWNSGCKYVH